MGAAAWTRKLARSFRPGCTEARAAQPRRALALTLSGPATASALPVTVVSSLRRAWRLDGDRYRAGVLSRASHPTEPVSCFTARVPS